MRSRLNRIGLCALPALGMALAAASFDARADDPQGWSGISAPELQAQMIANAPDERLSGFVGKPVLDTDGSLIGTVSDAVVADTASGDQAILLVSLENGESLAVPLGEPDAVVAQLNGPAGITVAEEIVPYLIVPEYRTPESPGS